MKLKFKNGGIVKLQTAWTSIPIQRDNTRVVIPDTSNAQRNTGEIRATSYSKPIIDLSETTLGKLASNFRANTSDNPVINVGRLVWNYFVPKDMNSAIAPMGKMSSMERAAMEQAFNDMRSVKMPIYDEATVMRLPRREPLYNPSTSSGISEAGGRVLGRTTRGTMSKADLMEPSYGSIGRKITQREINQQKIDFLQKRIDEYNRYARESNSAWSEMYKKWALEAEQQLKELLTWMR